MFGSYAANLTGEREHGPPVNQYVWYLEGWHQAKTGQCNTYVMKDEYVS